jgi:trans-aconitate methyltransferase
MQQKDLWNGEIYNQSAILQYALDERVLESFPFHGHEKVLDVGCGDGAITSLIAAFVPNGVVVGIDSSSSMIDFAVKTYCPLYPNIVFDSCAVENMNYNAEFDVITSFCSLHLVNDLPLALENIYNALKDSGKTLLFFPLLDENPWYQELQHWLPRTSWGKTINMHMLMPVGGKKGKLDEVSLTNDCQAAGFSAVHITVSPHSYTFPTETHCRVWIEAMLTMFKKPITLEEEEEMHFVSNQLIRFFRNQERPEPYQVPEDRFYPEVVEEVLSEEGDGGQKKKNKKKESSVTITQVCVVVNAVKEEDTATI